MDDERSPADLPDDLHGDLPEGLDPSQLRELVEQARSEMGGAPRSERVEGEVLQRVLQRVDLPQLSVDTRIRLIETVREAIQHVL